MALSKGVDHVWMRVRCPSMPVSFAMEPEKGALGPYRLRHNGSNGLTGPWIVRHYEERQR